MSCTCSSSKKYVQDMWLAVKIHDIKNSWPKTICACGTFLGSKVEGFEQGSYAGLIFVSFFGLGLFGIKKFMLKTNDEEFLQMG